MPSDLIAGTYSCENNKTLQGDLKGALKFPGWVVSDWGADHGSVGSLNAGMDQSMMQGLDEDEAQKRVRTFLTIMKTFLLWVG